MIHVSVIQWHLWLNYFEFYTNFGTNSITFTKMFLVPDPHPISYDIEKSWEMTGDGGREGGQTDTEVTVSG